MTSDGVMEIIERLTRERDEARAELGVMKSLYSETFTGLGMCTIARDGFSAALWRAAKALDFYGQYLSAKEAYASYKKFGGLTSEDTAWHSEFQDNK